MNKMFFVGAGAGFSVAVGLGLLANYIWNRRFKKKIVDKEVEKAVSKVLKQLDEERKSKEKENSEVSKRESKETVVSGVVGAVASRERSVSYQSIINNYSDPYLDSDPAEYEHPSESPYSETEEEQMNVSDCEKYERMVEKNQFVTDENRDYIEGEEEDTEMHSGKRPKLITWESYMNDKPNFDKVQLAYYTGENGDDSCLVDVEADEQIFDEDKVVGDCLDKYGFRNNDEDVIYVRNFAFGADYEIAKYIGPWKDEYETFV